MMIKEFIETKIKKKEYYSTDEFKVFLHQMQSSIISPVFIENEGYIKVIDSLFENFRDSIFFNAGKDYHLIYGENIYSKYYHKILMYVVSPLEKKVSDRVDV